MTENDLLAALGGLCVLFRETLGFAAGVVLDQLRELGFVGASLAVVGVLAIHAGFGFLVQTSLNERLRLKPDTPVSMWKLELGLSVLGVVLAPVWAVLGAGRGLFDAFSGVKKKKGSARTPGPRADAQRADDDPPPAQPVLAASIGPSFALASMVCAAMYLLSWPVGTLVRAQLGLSPGYPTWEYVFLGFEPNLAWYVPLSRFPRLAALLAAVFWTVVWWWTARGIRLWLRRDLGRSLLDARRDRSVLPLWRQLFGVEDLVEPHPTYRRWARWLPMAALPLLAFAWFNVDGHPYRVPPGLMAVASLVWLGWALHLTLHGHVVEAPEVVPEPEPEPEPDVAPGWDHVVVDLAHHHGISTPTEAAPARPIARLRGVSGQVGVYSPLLTELLPGVEDDSSPAAPTDMQHAVLELLAGMAFRHVPAPSGEGLALADAAPTAGSETPRNVLVLAPEATGRTTLAVLVATDQVLTHTRGALVVTRDLREAERIHARFMAALGPSTLRWNVRVRRLGSDLAQDLARGIVPDILITTLEQLAVTVLDDPDPYAPFLRTLGLVVVDDVESYCGPVEVHAQLTFRRMRLRIDEITGARAAGEGGPVLLVLGADGMHDTPAWARALVGGDLVVRRFQPRPGVDGGPAQRFFRLDDLRDGAGRSPTLAEVAAACERRGVAWHYRLCGDPTRAMGRRPLLLAAEPYHHQAEPMRAAVVLLEGHATEVHREIERLPRAGGEQPEGCAILTAADPELRGAFDALRTEDAHRSIAAAAARTLPRPIVRRPGGAPRLAHLAAELTESWTEVGDLVEVFGPTVAETLRGLVARDLLLGEDRTDVREDTHAYTHRLYVRALTRAVGASGGQTGLPARVAQVDLVSDTPADVRDRTSLRIVAREDAGSAPYVYYPGRVFASALGRFVVVGRAGGDADTGEILVEPALDDERTAPRRRIRLLDADDGYAHRTVVYMGDAPLAIGHRPVDIEIDHVATVRLSPMGDEVRRTDHAAPRAAAPLSTEALVVVPNPLLPDDAPARAHEAPALDLQGARVLSAVMRAILPSLYRDAGRSLDVGLHLVPRRPAPDRILEPDEGLVVFDLHAGGNNASEALHRDGIELLLRLCRAVLERVEHPARLCLLHDTWGVRGAATFDLEPERIRAGRDGALAWLEARLGGQS